MRPRVPDKLLAIVDEIDAHGSARLTRLTVLEKWFEHPGRLAAFGLWIAKRAAGRKGRTKAAAGELLDEARALLGTTATREDFLRVVDREAAKRFQERAGDFQSEFQRQQGGAAGSILCWPLLLVEQGLALYLGQAQTPAEGCKLAAGFCLHRHSRHGNSLTGASRTKIMEIVRFMFSLEAIEESDGQEQRHAAS